MIGTSVVTSDIIRRGDHAFRAFMLKLCWRQSAFVVSSVKAKARAASIASRPCLSSASAVQRLPCGSQQAIGISKSCSRIQMQRISHVPKPPVVAELARTHLLQTLRNARLDADLCRAYLHDWELQGGRAKQDNNKPVCRVANTRALIYTLHNGVCRVCGQRSCYKQLILAPYTHTMHMFLL